MALTTNNIYPDGSVIVEEFLYLTVCMEGKNIFACLDNYAQRHGSGIKEDMGCYFACELNPKDHDRVDNNVLVYQETDSGVKKVHLSEKQFYHDLEKALNRTAFLFGEEEWRLVQTKLAQLKSVLCTD